MSTIIVRLIKPLKGKDIVYRCKLLQRTSTHMLVLALWEWPPLDLGYVVLEPGDQFYEHFYSDRWYNIFELYATDGQLKGWYCNLTRPARLYETIIESEDLELDVFVSPDRQTILMLDQDEYNARGLEQHEPDAHQAVMSALDELIGMVKRGEAPFTAR